jgi:TRAP-type C4-dicarboxylate transport system substrate-binding protein
MKVYQLTAKSINYRTTTVNWADIYSAMQTGVVDGWIGGTPDVNYLTFKDVQNYYVAYNNFVECNAFIMGKGIYESLGDDGPIVRDIFKATAEASFEAAQKQDDHYIGKMEEYGLKIIRPTPEQAQQLSDSIHNEVWPKLYDLYGKEIFDSILADLGEG